MDLELPPSRYEKGEVWGGNPQDTSEDEKLADKFPPELIAKARYFNEMSTEIVSMATDLLTGAKAVGKKFITEALISIVKRVDALESNGAMSQWKRSVEGESALPVGSLKLGDLVWINTDQAHLPDCGPAVCGRVISSDEDYTAVTINGLVKIVPLSALHETEEAAKVR